MSSFCRHRRLEATCPICAKKRAKEEREAGRALRPPRPPAARTARRSGSATRRRTAVGADVRVRRLARAADDGYRCELVPGLHATADAELLAEELAFAMARLAELAGSDAPAAYAAARAAGGEEGLWRLFQLAVLGAGAEDGPEAFAAFEAVRVPWEGGELPALEEARFGPRGVGDAARATQALGAYRAWAERGGGQAAALAGEPGWTPERRFDRALERLALPGLARAQRYEFLATAGALGLADVRPAALHLMEEPRDPAVVAAKRVFGIGDPLLVARRAGEVASAAAVPAAAFDLGLVNWGRCTDDPEAPRIACGSAAVPDPDALALLADALHLPEDEPDDDAGADG